MNKNHYLGKPMAALSMVMLGLGTFGTPAMAADPTANSTPGEPMQIAQANLCRRVRVPEGLIIRERPDPSSRFLGSVGYNGTVTLIENYQAIKGPDNRNWLQISGPIAGYVSNGFTAQQSNLVYCTGTVGTRPPTTTPTPTTPPPTTTNLCRRVDPLRAPQGLAIRSDASGIAPYIGGVAPNERVTLVTNYSLIRDKSGAARNFVQITAPVAGYVSAASLVYCP